MALSNAEQAKRERERKDELIQARRPSAVDRLAALADPSGSAAERIALWEERQAWVDSAHSLITSSGQEPHVALERLIREKLGGFAATRPDSRTDA